MPRRILLIDGNAPWVRSLFAALPTEIELYTFRVHTPAFYRKAPRLFLQHVPGWRKGTAGLEKYVGVPGWTRAFNVSTRLLAWECQRLIRRVGKLDAIVYTIPQYAGVAEQIRAAPAIYQSLDPYRHYGWNVERTIALEQRMMSASKMVLAVSRALTEDFLNETQTKVCYFPNAVAESFLTAVGLARPTPEDLQSISGKIVGCTGQMNSSYDWGLIKELAKRLPELTFVFVGPIFDEGPDVRAKIDCVLSRPNVRWTGPKDHADLPAYLARFDVCFNPLAMNAHNDRRSPLRLYDYMATDKPILSTAIREAFEHVPHLEIGCDVDECWSLLRRMTQVDYHTDLPARHSYIRRNTWRVRAEEFSARLEEAIFEGSGHTRSAVDSGNEAFATKAGEDKPH